MFRRPNIWLMLISVLLFSPSVFALATDRQQKLILNSATAQMNLETGVSIYEGSVRVEQGSTQLRADKLIIHTDKQNQLQQATAIGKPAHYRTLPQLNKPEFHADADTIEYYPPKNLVVLIGNAKAYQNNNVYTGPRIEYNTVTQTIISPQSATGRTTIIIQQKTSSAKTTNKD